MVVDDNPTLHEDAQPLPGGEPTDDLPSLVPSTNPLFPNAIVKKPPNTHAKSSLSKQTSQSSEKKGPGTPKVVTGKNAPVSRGSNVRREAAERSIGWDSLRRGV